MKANRNREISQWRGTFRIAIDDKVHAPIAHNAHSIEQNNHLCALVQWSWSLGCVGFCGWLNYGLNFFSFRFSQGKAQEIAKKAGKI